MFRLTRSLLSMLAAAALPAGYSVAQPPELEDRPNAMRTLCPMPVASAPGIDRSRVFRPRTGTRYHIQMLRVPCHNPLFARPDEPVLVTVPKPLRPEEELGRREKERSAAARSSETRRPVAEDDARLEK